ncbi:hypothetical protein BT69DRAFT_203265 [Atractiella rhizophila]|nr:hypothetical protein BT69DRAFT_203265 [Atractiella rhizophila]
MISSNNILFAILGAAISANAQGIVDNRRVAGTLFDQAVPFDGNYKLTNVGTGKTLVYTHTDQPNMYPDDDSPSTILSKMSSSVDQPRADDVFELLSNPNNDGSTRIRNADSNKALASQWDYDSGTDKFGVAYVCQVGPGCQDEHGLEPDKQWWLFVPVGESGSDSDSSERKASIKSNAKVVKEADDSDSKDDGSSDDNSSDDGSSSGGKCDKNPDWIFRHGTKEFYRKHPECKGLAKEPSCRHPASFLKAHPEYLDDHPECRNVVKSRLAHKVRRSHAGMNANVNLMQKRGQQAYAIIVVDHILNMTTRAISGNEIAAFADARSTLMVDYDPTDKEQWWTVTEA